MREIILDTETTGLDPYRGDRLVEIGCIELLNRISTGETFHCYINPERDMPQQASSITRRATFPSSMPSWSAPRVRKFHAIA